MALLEERLQSNPHSNPHLTVMSCIILREYISYVVARSEFTIRGQFCLLRGHSSVVPHLRLIKYERQHYTLTAIPSMSCHISSLAVRYLKRSSRGGSQIQIGLSSTGAAFRTLLGTHRTRRLQQRPCQHSGPLTAGISHGVTSSSVGMSFTGRTQRAPRSPPVSRTTLSFHDNAGLQTSKGLSVSQRLT